MNRRIKILFLLPDLQTGGAEMVMMRLMNGLNRNRFSISCAVIRNQGRLKEYLNNDIVFHDLEGRASLTALASIYRLIRRTSPNIVISTMAHMNFAALLIGIFFPKIRYIVRESTLPACTLHGRGIGKPVIKMLYRLLYPHAALILAPAHIILEKMQKELRLRSTKMMVLPNPVDEEFIRARTTPKTTKEKLFVSAGRLHHEKGYDQLIAALGGWSLKPAWRLDIIGEGPERKNLQILIENHNLQNHVTLKGFQKNPWQAMAQADAFLLPSRWEGLPNVALESLACGTPVIAMREAGGIVEIAAAAPPGAVILCDRIEEMRAAMDNIEKSPDKKSLLPPSFEKTAVLEKFEELLVAMIQETP